MLENKQSRNIGILIMALCLISFFIGDITYKVEMNKEVDLLFYFLQFFPYTVGISLLNKNELKYHIFIVIGCVVCSNIIHMIFINVSMISFIIQILLIVVYTIYVKSQLNKVA